MNNNLALTLKLDANGNLVGVVNQATGSVAKFGETVNGVTAKTKALGTEGEKAFGKTRAGVESISKQLEAMKGSFATAFNFTALVGSGYALTKTVDQFTAMQSQIKLLTESASGLNYLQNSLEKVALNTFSGLPETVKLFSSLDSAMLSLGRSTDQSIAFTQTFNKALSLTNPTTAEAQSTILQFSQAMGNGALRGEEFNSIMENGRGVAQALANGLGVPIGALRAMAEEGKLTADVVIQALEKQSTAIDALFAKKDQTIGQAMQNLSTQSMLLVGSIDQTTGASRGLVSGISLLSDNLQDGAKVVGVMAAAYSVALIPSLLRAVTALWATTAAATGATTALTAASVAAARFALTPWGAAITAGAGALAYLYSESNKTADAMDRLRDAASVANNGVIDEVKLKASAEELRKLEKALKDALDTNDLVVDQAKFDKHVADLRARIAQLNADPLSIDIVTDMDIEAAERQTKQIYQNADQWVKAQEAIKIKIEADFGESIGKMQEQYALIGLSARDAAIAQAQFALQAKAAKEGGTPTADQLAAITSMAAKLFDQNEAAKKLASSTKAYADEQKKATAERLKWLSASQSADYDQFKGNLDLEEAYSKKIADQGKAIYEATRTGYEKLNIELANLDHLYAQGAFDNVGGFDTYSRAIMDAYDKASDAGKNLTNEQKENMRELQQAIDGWGKDSARAVADFALSGKGSFSDFANSVVKDLMTMMIYQNMTKPLMNAAGSWMGSLFGGGVSDAGASSAASIGASYWKDGGVFSGVQAFANGGTFTNSIVDRATPFQFANGGKFNLGVMGEAGAEAVMPLTRIGGKLGVLAQGVGGGGVTNVVVNVTNNAGESVQANARQSTNSNGETIIDVVIDKVKGAMMQDVGSNGQFSQAFAGAYGLSRRAF